MSFDCLKRDSIKASFENFYLEDMASSYHLLTEVRMLLVKI